MEKINRGYSIILDSYFEQIEKIYEKNPNYVVDELNKMIKKSETEKYKEKSFLDKLFPDKDKELVLSVFLMILMVPICLFTLNNIQTLPIYFFGLAFFLAGLNVGFSTKGFGLIFLFSHGGVGMCIMLGALLSNVMTSGLFTDGGHNLMIYLAINLIIIIIGFLAVVVYNLSDYLKSIRYMKSYILLIFLFGLIMAGLFPYIINFIYRL